MDPWIAAAAEQIAARAPGQLERLVAISSPSGDVAGADAAIALVLELVPPGVRVERPPCSSCDHADDLIVTLGGSGSERCCRAAALRRAQLVETLLPKLAPRAPRQSVLLAARR